MPQVTIKSFGTAIIVAILVGLLNATVGFLIRLPMNILTLGLLSFVVRLFVTAIIIKMADKLAGGFEVKGFMPAIVMAVAMALAGTFIDRAFADNESQRIESSTQELSR
jgi:putative membrane protein